MPYKIGDSCIRCGACEPCCPVHCIHKGDSIYYIDEAKCIDCKACVKECFLNAIQYTEHHYSKYEKDSENNYDCLVDTTESSETHEEDILSQVNNNLKRIADTLDEIYSLYKRQTE